MFRTTLRKAGKGESVELTAYDAGNEPIRVSSVSYLGAMFVLSGTDSVGRTVTLMQHSSQVNLRITAVPNEPGRPETAIGFQPPPAGG